MPILNERFVTSGLQQKITAPEAPCSSAITGRPAVNTSRSRAVDSIVTAGIATTDAAARKVLDSAAKLAAESEVLRGEVDRFLASIRAA
jgi:hypothetical protein